MSTLIDKMKALGMPTVCPSCGNTLKWKSVDLMCDSPDCGVKQVKEVASFLIKCGVENATDKSLTNWNIATYDDLLSFEPDHSSKSQCKFASELVKNVFSKTQEALFACMTFDGAGESNINKLIEHFGNGDLTMTTRGLYLNGELENFPEGIGQKVVDKIEKNWKENLYHIKKIVSDPRWKPVAKVVTVSTGNLSGKTFLLTGSFTEGKAALEKMIKENGGELVSSVSKKLDILVCAPDSWGSSTKFTKAEKLGVRIVDEEYLKEMI
jgi:DNA ligase (NAD+)